MKWREGKEGRCRGAGGRKSRNCSPTERTVKVVFSPWRSSQSMKHSDLTHLYTLINKCASETALHKSIPLPSLPPVPWKRVRRKCFDGFLRANTHTDVIVITHVLISGKPDSYVFTCSLLCETIVTMTTHAVWNSLRAFLLSIAWHVSLTLFT